MPRRVVVVHFNPPNLDQPTVRRYGMDCGLVDFKVAAIDAT